MKQWLNPKWRILIFLGLSNVAWMVSAWLWFERENWLWMIPIALSINFLLLTYDQFLKFRVIEGQELRGNDPWGLLKIVHELCLELQVRHPDVILISSPSAQIFAYAKTGRCTRLFITEGMLNLLTIRQLRAAIVFQLHAIRGSYNILNYWLAAWLDLIFRAGKILERGFAFIFGWSPPLAAWVVAPTLWLLHFLLLGSGDFNKLDHQTAATIGNPDDLAQALWKMEAYSQTQPWPDPWIFAHMCMVSPLSRNWNYNGLRVQPPMQGRIKSLIGRFPI